MTDLFTRQPDVQPRQLLWRGVVQSRALWFANSLFKEQIARLRVLDLWQNGAVVYRFDDGLLLVFPTSQRVVCEVAPALPLVENRGVLLAAPLESDEDAQLFADKESRVGAVVLLRNGAAQKRNLRDATVEDLSQWIDVSAFVFADAQTLGAAPAAAAELVLQSDFDARQKLTQGEVAPEMQRVLAALRGEIEEKTTANSAQNKVKSGFQWPQMPPLRGMAGNVWNVLDGVRSWQKVRDGSAPMPLVIWWVLIAFFNWIVGGNVFTFLLAIFALWILREILPAVQIAQNATPVNPKETSSTRSAPKPTGEKKPWPMTGALSRLIMRSRLAGLVGRRHAKYIAQMMEMFERGDLDNALRHAIPLGKDGDGTSNPFIGRLAPRNLLQLAAGTSASSSSIGFGEELQTRLRQMYRQAFWNLKERERYEEAAFVLAELLYANEEAVAFLELHDRKVLAAQMAEARKLPAGLVVRQWFVADDIERAIAVARRHNAWADAVFRLEQKRDNRADYLRVLWARTLAHSGQYLAATETLWPVEAMRENARVFAQVALESGGAPGAKALARLVELDGANLNEDLKHRVLDLLNDEESDGATSRLAFATTLRQSAKTTQNSAMRAAARLATRSLLRDARNEYSNVDAKMWRGLLELAGDSALRADAPALPAHNSTPTLASRATPLDIVIEANDSGKMAVLDAALLPDGKTLVALGEAGAHLLNREGRVVHRFDQPCHKLVLSDGGDRAIALAPRGRVQTSVDVNYQPQWGDIYRLAHLDIARKSSRHWCEAALQSFADSYDGSVWFAGVERELAMIDALNPKFVALWKGGDTSGEIRNIARSVAQCSLLTYSPSPHSPPPRDVALDATRDVARNGWNRVLGNRTPDNRAVDNRVLEVPQEKCERWTFAVSGEPILRERQVAPSLFAGMVSPLRTVSAAGRVLVNAFCETQGEAERAQNEELFQPRGWLGVDARVALTVPPPHHASDCAQSQVLAAMANENWVVAPLTDERGAVCHVLNTVNLQTHARLDLGGANMVALRLMENHLVVVDDLGRVLALDLERGKLSRDLRV